MTKASDHDLLIVLNTKMDMLTVQMKDFTERTQKRFDDMEQTKLDLDKAEVLFTEKAEALVRGKAEALVREGAVLREDHEKRLRRLEWSVAIATGVVLALQFVLAYWQKLG